MKGYPFRIFSFLLIGLFSLGQARALEPQDDAEQIIRLMAQALPVTHLSHNALSEILMRRTVENYLRALDFDRTLLKADDVAHIRRQVPTLLEMIEEGDPSFPFEVFLLVRERAQNRVEFVTELLDNGFDLESNDVYQWRRKDAPWAADAEEWDDLWRRKIQNEVVGLMVGRELREQDAEEAMEEKDSGEPSDDEADEGYDDAAAENVDEDEEEAPAWMAPDLSPEERILKRYTRMIEMLNGHDSEFVLGTFLSSFAGAYDAHSSYLSPRREEDFDIQMRLSLTGIGAELTYDEGAARIQRIIKGGPAHRDGRLQQGDRIVAVQQEDEEPVDILYWPLYRSVRLIRGEIGTTVVLHVIPASDPTGSELQLIDLVRDEIKLEEKAARSKIYPLEREGEEFRLGIIHLPDFYADFSAGNSGEATSSATDVRRLLEELNAEEVDGLVMDLRNNGGGSLRDCVEMSGFFIDSGPVVQVRSGRRVNQMSDPRRGVMFEKPLVILVNRLSASASEILAAALQDYGRAIIVGDSKTHGKGTVQTLMPLDRRNDAFGALKVTTAGFYRIDGRSTQLKGVTPDIIIRSSTDVMELGEEYLPNVLPWTWVQPLRFQPFGDLSAYKPELTNRSRLRLQGNEKFQTYQEKVNRLQERVEREKVPLNFNERLEQARMDRELDRLQGSNFGITLDNDNGDDEEDDREQIRPERDLVLNESLHILADLIELTAVTPGS